MSELLKLYQGTIFEMYLSGKLEEWEFNFLAALTEGMKYDNEAVKLALVLTMEDIRDIDLINCITAKQFKTALTILE